MSQPEIYIRPSVGMVRSIIAVIDDLDLRLNHPEDLHSCIHRIRVDIKQLRAWIRLVRDKSDRQYWRTIDHNLRDISKQLSAGRDQQAAPETLEWLEKKAGTPENHSAVRILRLHFQSVVDKKVLTPELVNVPDKGLLETLKRKSFSWQSDVLFRKGLKRTFKRTSRLGKKAYAAHARFNDLHVFRKWVKYLYYQIGFIQIPNAGQYEKIHHQLDKLGKRLGRIHDLVMVRQKLRRMSPASEWTESAEIAEQIIDRKIDKLLKTTKRSYKKIFTRLPSEFVLEQG